MNRCIYCNKETPNPIMVKSSKKDSAEEYPCCSEDCFKKATSFFQYIRYTMIFFGVLLICSLSLILARALEFTLNDIFISCGLMLLGVTIFIFPFSNGIEFMGIKKSKIIVRCTGGFILFMGIITLI